MSGSPWAPVHHEQIDDESDAGTETRAPSPRKTDGKPKSDDKHVPMALSLAIPADFIATMSAVAGAMSEVASAMADQTKAMMESTKATQTLISLLTGTPREVKNDAAGAG